MTDQAADLIIVARTVHTLAGDAPPVTTLAVRDGRIAATAGPGDRGELTAAWRGPGTVIFDEPGLVVLPAFVDTTVRGRLSSWRREVCGLRWPAGLGLLTGQLLRMVTGAGPGCCGHGGWPGGPGRPACRSWRVMVFSRPGVRRRPVAPCVST